MRSQAGEVTLHYDELDPVYRAVWGEHLHHGLWLSGDESPEEAATAMCEFVASQGEISHGQRVCDVGCGYGALARYLVAERGAQVDGLTISGEQQRRAIVLNRGAGNPQILLGDWLEIGLDSEIYDAVVAVESTEHMSDHTRAMLEMRRVLKPGGRVVICAWLTKDVPSAWQRRHLLDPIREVGRLFGLRSEPAYLTGLETAGFHVVACHNFSKNVRRTWALGIWRSIRSFLANPEVRRLISRKMGADLGFGLVGLRILVAYATGALRYVAFTAEKPR